MNNIGAILAEANATFEDILKCSVFARNLSQFQAINEAYSNFFDAETASAREFEEGSKLPRNGNVEISAIALVSNTKLF